MNRFAYIINAKDNQQMFQYFGKAGYLKEVLNDLLQKEKAVADQSKTA